ncbi:MAG TPA: 2-amino-4-hydroxy-6-hydroxymethyldihydropteridine diphosphokinase [Acidimicrobiia bacterium]|nr:2-amino-4-hydroxy-6-hydroxymethyldihydropteridine diphosphokinase [Acidimicrobiia bacterium]
MTNRAAIALGSNLGDRLSHLRFAVERLARLGSVVAVSSLYETAPVGGPEQGPYLNAVVVIDTHLTPAELLAQTQTIETEAGRVRTERWGPRTLDLDIVTMTAASGAAIEVQATDLEVPHPRAPERRFVLEPLAEVWPDAPLGATTAAEYLPDVEDQEVERIGTAWTDPRQGVAFAWLAAQVAFIVAWALLVVATADLPVRWGSAMAGVVLVAVGAGVAGWAVAAMGGRVSPLPEPRPGARLVDSGPFRWIRHPIYSGLVLAMLGVAVIVRSPLAAVGALAVGALLWFKARYEESRLRLAVEGYADYQRRVRGRMVPLPPT